MDKYSLLRTLFIGYHSLYIYCMQMIVMDMTRIFANRLLHINNIPALVLIVWAGGIFIPIIFYRLSQKYGLWWLFTSRKPKYMVQADEQLSPVPQESMVVVPQKPFDSRG